MSSPGHLVQRTNAAYPTRQNSACCSDDRTPAMSVIGLFQSQTSAEALRASMGYCGTPTIQNLQFEASFIRMSPERGLAAGPGWRSQAIHELESLGINAEASF